MIRCFLKSRIISVGILFLFLILAVAVVVNDLDKPIYIPIIACILLLGLGIILSRLAGNIVADRENMHLLSILHIDLDPERFITAYLPVVNRLPEGSRLRLIAEGYLAVGYDAAGRFDEALSLLEKPAPNDPALAGTRAVSRISCYIGSGRAAVARRELSALDSIISETKRDNLRQNLSASRRLLEARLHTLEGLPVDRAELGRALDRAPYQLQRLEILEALARDADRLGQKEKAQACHDRLHKEAGKTRYLK